MNVFIQEKGDSLFDGAVSYSAAEKGSFTEVDGYNIFPPGGTTFNVTKTIRTKKIKTTVTLAPGEIVVEYYRGTDSSGVGKGITMTVSDADGNAVFTESNSEISMKFI